MNNIAVSSFETGMECVYLHKQLDFMLMNSADCLHKASGYICEICECRDQDQKYLSISRSVGYKEMFVIRGDTQLYHYKYVSGVYTCNSLCIDK